MIEFENIQFGTKSNLCLLGDDSSLVKTMECESLTFLFRLQPNFLVNRADRWVDIPIIVRPQSYVRALSEVKYARADR